MRWVPVPLHNGQRDTVVANQLSIIPAGGDRHASPEEGTRRGSPASRTAPTSRIATLELLTNRARQKCEHLPGSAIKGWFQAFAKQKSELESYLNQFNSMFL